MQYKLYPSNTPRNRPLNISLIHSLQVEAILFSFIFWTCMKAAIISNKQKQAKCTSNCHLFNSRRSYTIAQRFTFPAALSENIRILWQNSILLKQEKLNHISVVKQLAHIFCRTKNRNELSKATPEMHHMATRIMSQYGPQK